MASQEILPSGLLLNLPHLLFHCFLLPSWITSYVLFNPSYLDFLLPRGVSAQTSMLLSIILVSLKLSKLTLLIPAHSEGWSWGFEMLLSFKCSSCWSLLFLPKFLHFSLQFKDSVEYFHNSNFLFNYLKLSLEDFLFLLLPFFLLHSFILLQSFGSRTGPVFISLTMVLNVFFFKPVSVHASCAPVKLVSEKLNTAFIRA